jgi:hypothetical protein
MHFRFELAKYQSRHGLAADGIVGPQTWARINHELGISPSPTPISSAIVSVYQYYATTPVLRYLYSATKSADFVRDGWTFDRVVFRAFTQNQPGVVPVYRYVAKDPWRYQLSRQAAIGQGWTKEGTVFYAYTAPQNGNAGLPEPLQPIYQHYAIDDQGRWRYQYSLSPNIGNGWKSEGPAFYALIPPGE